MDGPDDILMMSANGSSDCQLAASPRTPQPKPHPPACDSSAAAAASLSPSKFSSSTPTKEQQQQLADHQRRAQQLQPNAGYELLYSHGPSGTMDVSLRTPSGARYYNPFLRWEPRVAAGHIGGLTVSPGIFAPTAAVAAAAAAAVAAAAATLSPDRRARACPDAIDSSEETALKQEAYSARLTAHWDSHFCDQGAIEAYFKSQIIAPSPAGFDDGRFGWRPRTKPHVECETDSAPRWNVSTQTILSIPVFFDLAAIISDDDEAKEAELNNFCGGCYGESAAGGAAESSPVRPSPPQSSQLPVTPDRVVKAFQVLPSSGSPQLGLQPRPKLLPNFQPMEAIRERSYCSIDTTSDSQSQQASLFSSSHLQQLQQQQQQQQQQQYQLTASSCDDDASIFQTASSGSSMSDLAATLTPVQPAGQGAAAAPALANCTMDDPMLTPS